MCFRIYIRTIKTVLDSLIDANHLRENFDTFDQWIIMLFSGIQEILQFKERKKYVNSYVKIFNVKNDISLIRVIKFMPLATKSTCSTIEFSYIFIVN